MKRAIQGMKGSKKNSRTSDIYYIRCRGDYCEKGMVIFMNIKLQGAINSFFGGYSVFSHKGLKSTEEKLERQEKRDDQVAFFEKQKENLKNRKCDTVEEIAEKLNALKSYDDQIAGIKAAYNNEQMWHILDEAKEIGEKIAEAAEKLEPKTPEERLEEIVEEATGTEDSGGLLEEIMEDAAQSQEELQESVEEEMLKQLDEDMQEQLDEKLSEDMQEQLDEKLSEDLQERLDEKLSEDLQERLEKELSEDVQEQLAEKILYKPFNILI